MLEIVELPSFSKVVDKYWTDEEFLVFETFIVSHPEAGAVIRGSGGVMAKRASVAACGLFIIWLPVLLQLT